ncbi:MAG: lipoate--protein ligase family protein [Armatimonadetes bacterium]|nr:lipoate--protein ligase family protein [Armatimonadota bacterium]
MRWRVIPYEEKDAVRNMAEDEAVLEAFIMGQSPPTVKFYGWTEPSVTIGRLQSASSVPEGWGSGIVRRPTGGRAVFHKDDLTFSLVVGSEALGTRVQESYRRVGEAAARALNSLGINAGFCRNTTAAQSVRKIGKCFDLTLDYELAVQGTKVLGSAQVRRAGAVLQQNSLALSSNTFWPARDKIIDGILYEVEQEFCVETVCGGMSALELQIASELADNKYAVEEWNLGGVCPAFSLTQFFPPCYTEHVNLRGGNLDA